MIYHKHASDRWRNFLTLPFVKNKYFLSRVAGLIKRAHYTAMNMFLLTTYVGKTTICKESLEKYSCQPHFKTF